MFPSRGKQTLNDCLGLRPLPAQRGHDHGVNHEFNVCPAGEVRPELRAGVRVKAAFEQGAEDGRVNGAPIEGRGGGDALHFIGGQVKDGVIVEQVAVEMADRFKAEVAAGRHGVEELRQNLAEAGGVAGRLLHDAAEDHIGQEADVFGEEAENQAVQEVGDGGWVKAARAHGGGNFGELAGGVLGDGGARAAWA